MHIPAIMSTTSLSFSSIRFFKTRIPLSIYNNNKTPILKTSTFLSTPTQTFFSFKPITFQRLPTKPSSSSSSSPPPPPPPSDSFQPIEDLPPKLQEIVKLFQSVQEPKAKYEQLLFYAKNLKPLDAQFKTDENKVEGCVSQVWVRAYLDQERNVFYEADSDSVLTKGLAALLVHGFSGRPVNEVLRVSPNFIVLLGLQQKLTVSRNNGFLNMLKLMQKKALLLYVEAEKGASEMSSISSSDSKDDSFIKNSNDSPATQSPGSDVNLSSELHDKDIELSSISSSDSKDDSFIENSSDSPATQSPGSDVNLSSELDDKDIELSSISSSDSKDDSFIENSSDSPATQPPGSDVNLSSELHDKDIELGGRGKRIKEKLEKELDPVELQIEDVSYQHAGHAGVRGSDGETHFNLKVVSKEFEGKSLVKRHRLIYNLLQEELQSGLHALSIVPKTPSEVNGG